MKNSISIFFILVALLVWQTGCNKKLELYQYPQNGINILDTFVRYSFVYSPSGTLQDTVWIHIETMGFVTVDERPVAFEQITGGERDAVAGVHYIAFEHTELQKYYIMPGNSATTVVPVVLIRDPSLGQDDYTLLFKVKGNEYFGRGIVGAWTCRILIADRLTRPVNWNPRTNDEFGNYGRVKHRWLIEQTGNKWDEEYLRDVLGYAVSTSSGIAVSTNSNYDSGYIAYYRVVLQNMLNEFNTQNGSLLMEEDETPVKFM